MQLGRTFARALGTGILITSVAGFVCARLGCAPPLGPESGLGPGVWTDGAIPADGEIWEPAVAGAHADLKLDVTPSGLYFGTASESRFLLVRNLGSGSLEYCVSSDVGWVALEGAQGVSSGEYKRVSVYVDRGGLAPGTYEGQLTVTASDQQIPVTLQMTVPDPEDDVTEPVLYVGASELDFGAERTSASFVVRNVGGGTLNYTVRANVGWATPWPEEGANTGEDHVIEVSVTREGLDPGEYTGLVSVETEDGQWHGLVMYLTVPASLEVSPERLDFGLEGLQLWFTVRNSREGTLAYEISPTADWMEVDPTSGQSGGEEQTIWVTVTRGSCTWEPGLNEAEIVVEAENGERHTVTVTVEVPAAPSDEEIVEWLRPLSPLPKVHYGYPITVRLLREPGDPLLYEWVRIAHSVPLSPKDGGWVSPSKVYNAVAVCQQINDTNPEIPATLALNWWPYHLFLPAEVPPTYDGPECQQELDEFEERFSLVASWLDDANAALRADVQVSAILFDCEMWFVKEEGEEGYEEWNSALAAKYDAFYLLSKSIFPDVPVHWHSRGKPWRYYRRFNFEELGDACGAELYCGYDLPWTRAYFRAHYEEAQAHDVDSFVAWFSMGAGYWTLPNGARRYIWDLNYDVSLAWQLGAEANGYAPPPPDDPTPWDGVTAIAFFPGPFDGRTPQFAKYFVAYVRGAQGLPLDPQ